MIVDHRVERVREVAEVLGHLRRAVGDREGVEVPAQAEAILAKALDNARLDHPDWVDRVKSLAGGLRSALLSQRDGARIVGGNYAAKRANLSFVDSLVGNVRAGGLAREHALWAASSLFCYVLGEVLEQQGATGGETEMLEVWSAR